MPSRDMPSRERSCSCGIDAAIDVVDGAWKALSLRAPEGGPRRFGEQWRLVDGVTWRMLVQVLRGLEREGIVHREVHHQAPPGWSTRSPISVSR